MTALELPMTAATGRQTQGVTPVYRPQVDGADLDISVSKLEVSLAEFQHDVATMACTSPTITDTAPYFGKPISFYFGLSPRTELFTGYIESITEDKERSGGGMLAFTMGCLGATKEMQTGVPRQWLNSTVPQTVESLAYAGLLGFHGHGHPLVWESLAQTEETDWKLASNLAKRLGWSVFNRYGVVMLYNPLTLFKENGSFIDLIAAQYASAAFEDYERSLVDFAPIEESTVAYRQMGAKVAYFNGDVVQTVTQRGKTYETYKYLTNLIVRSPEEAEVYANSSEYRASSWGQQASARVLGNAAIYPGMCVDVYTSNPRYYKGRYDGRWLVRGVQHQADRQTFQSQLALARPNSTTGVSMSPYVPFWNQPSSVRFITDDTFYLSSEKQPGNQFDTMPIGSITNKPRPTLMLVEGQWQSSWTRKVLI